MGVDKKKKASTVYLIQLFGMIAKRLSFYSNLKHIKDLTFCSLLHVHDFKGIITI